MGAININTNKYEYPIIANKANKYKCPSCERDVIFRNGKINIAHFCHLKSDCPCSYYNKPNESQIHKDAKLLMKTLLDNKQIINIYRKCYYCNDKPIFFLTIKNEECYDDVSVELEHRFDFNNSKKSADVALLKNNEIKRGISVDDIKIECIRDYKCVKCIEKEDYERKKHLELLEKVREENLERNERLLMSNEDIRTIEIKIRIEEERTRIRDEMIEREKKWENDRRLRNEKLKEEKQLKLQLKIEREKKVLEERQKAIDDFNKKMIELNKVCSICKINYCKCLEPNFVKDNYNRIKCENCNKMKCICVRITDFFKNNNDTQ